MLKSNLDLTGSGKDKIILKLKEELRSQTAQLMALQNSGSSFSMRQHHRPPSSDQWPDEPLFIINELEMY